MRRLELLAGAALAAMLTFVAGCAGGPDTAGGPCLDDSQPCIDSRVALVKTMAADPSNAWIKEPVSHHTAQSGVRLFAYQSSADRLSCEEIAAGMREMQHSKALLAKGPLPGVTAERNNQVKALTDDVAARLASLHKSKACKA